MNARPFHITEIIERSAKGAGTITDSSTLAEAMTFLSELADDSPRSSSNICPQCASLGRTSNLVSFDDEGDLARCPLCDGWGYNETPQGAIISGYGPLTP